MKADCFDIEAFQEKILCPAPPTVDSVNNFRGVIADAAEFLLGLPQEECPLVHRFAPGVYIREITMPKGAFVIGKIHATEHFNVILKGHVTVATGDGVRDYFAGDTFVSESGVQKVVYMHEKCVWQTIHATDKTDIDEIVAEITVEKYEDLESDGLLNKVRLLQ